MVMGLGAQMIAWRDQFCDLLGSHGLRVIRFDNRDAGLSHHSEGDPPGIAQVAPLATPFSAIRKSGWQPSYGLSDMAGDAVAVLDAVGLDSAHVVGASMGGMISQLTAIEHPERVRSLTSIMSTTGNPLAGRPTVRALKAILTPPPEGADRQTIINHGADRHAVIAGSTFEREAMEKFLAEAYDRDYFPNGAAFQVGAILSAEDRTKRLAELNVPTLVIHGRSDPLIRLSGGIATAKAVPDAQLLVFNKMGHSLPMMLWDELTDAIGRHCLRAEARHIGLSEPVAAVSPTG